MIASEEKYSNMRANAQKLDTKEVIAGKPFELDDRGVILEGMALPVDLVWRDLPNVKTIFTFKKQ